MKLAILMSTYNGEKYLSKQLESIAEQSVIDNITLYIRDDGSTDATYKIIEEWSKKIQIHLIKGKNVGPSKSFWELLTLREIEADYFAFCDQDDIWDSDKLECAVDKLKDNTHFYYSNCRLIDKNNQMINKNNRGNQSEISIPRLFIGGVTQGCSMVFTSELRNYIMSKKITCIPMHDIIVMLYAISFGEIYYDDEYRFSYRVHDSNVVAKNNKNLRERINTTYWNWNNSSKNSLALVASEMLENIKELQDDEVNFLRNMSCYRQRIACKLNLLFDKRIIKVPFAIARSYVMRIILNLL